MFQVLVANASNSYELRGLPVRPCLYQSTISRNNEDITVFGYTTPHRVVSTYVLILQAPPVTYSPPLGASMYTWPNVYRNLKNIDYCVDQFDYIRLNISESSTCNPMPDILVLLVSSNRVKCIQAYTGGPFLN